MYAWRAYETWQITKLLFFRQPLINSNNNTSYSIQILKTDWLYIYNIINDNSSVCVSFCVCVCVHELLQEHFLDLIDICMKDIR